MSGCQQSNKAYGVVHMWTQHWPAVLEEGEHINNVPVVTFISAAKTHNLSAKSNHVLLHEWLHYILLLFAPMLTPMSCAIQCQLILHCIAATTKTEARQLLQCRRCMICPEHLAAQPAILCKDCCLSIAQCLQLGASTTCAAAAAAAHYCVAPFPTAVQLAAVIV